MAHSALSELIPKNEETSHISPEALLRANAVAESAIAVLEKNPDGQKALQVTFREMISSNLRNPASIREIQDGLYKARDARLATLKPSEKLGALESFSGFMRGFTDQIAILNRDIPLSNDLHSLTNATNAKIDQVRNTYAGIIANDHPTQTA